MRENTRQLRETARMNEREYETIERVADRVCGLIHTLTEIVEPMLHQPIVARTLDDVFG